MNLEFDITAFELENKFYDLTVSVEYEVSNDGIGSYEYWGAKCYDAGTDYAEATDWSVEATETDEDGVVSDVTDKALLSRLEKDICDTVHSHMQSVEITDDRDDREAGYDE